MAIKILMVCLGNICRSPLAEGILQSKVDPEQVMVDSAGTGGYHIGNAPDKRSIAVAKQHGISIAHQRCRQITKADFITFDCIYVMDKSNYASLLKMADLEQTSKVKLLLDEVAIGISEVPDPYYGGNEGFENVYQMISAACETIAQRLNANKES
ncbi:MAG: low molecular weight protein-tyrosine-phosphatase [Flavobacteriaceae bacterium]